MGRAKRNETHRLTARKHRWVSLRSTHPAILYGQWLLPLHKLRERFRKVRMPARQRGAVFDDVAGGPQHAPFVELPRHIVVRTEDVEVAGIDARDHEIDGLLRRPGSIGLLAAASRG